MKRFIIFCLLLAVVDFAYAVSPQDNGATNKIGQVITPKDTTANRRLQSRLIAPKGGWQCGLSVMYADISTSNSDYMMLLQGIDASASMLRLSMEGAYTYMPNHAVGARFTYSNLSGGVDTATADLLGNLSMKVSNLHAASISMAGAVFERTYVGLDPNGRIGVFWDYLLGYTWNKTQFYADEQSSTYSLNKKLHLGFSPGIVYFPMNNLSVQFSVCIADVSYNNVSVYNKGVCIGSRQAWKAQASLNVLDLNFGITIHL